MTLKIAIIDYGVGNLKSIENVLKYLQVDFIITSNSSQILNSDGIILPGVGAFADAMINFKKKKLIPIIQKTIIENLNKFLKGVCFGI